jgi:uroporphyrinogen decarboxylase
MSELTHRERVALALDHQEPDRVPVDFLGHSSLLVDAAYFRLKDHLGLKGDIEPFREGSTANYYDERLLDIFDVDFRRVFLPVSPAGRNRPLSADSFMCPWGIEWRWVDIYVHAAHGPLEGLDMDGVARYEWPDPSLLWNTEGLAERARQLYEETPHALVARNPLTYGFLDRACRLRGIEQFMVDMIADPELAQAIIDGILRVHLQVYDMFLQAVGPYVQVVETGDDLGGQDRLLISPALYRQFIKPAERELHKLIKARTLQARIFRHTDGAVYDIIPDLIETGIEILNPVQPSAVGMESARLKADFGDRLTFHGGVDQKPQEGSEEDIRAEVRRRIDAFAPGGGYILSTSNHIVAAPPENIVAMFDEAHRYGQYPLKG